MKIPYVILNAAMTLDGKISSKSGDSRISCEEDLDRTHKLRSEVDGVMVGIGTVVQDDPSLTVRRVSGENPVRIVVDSSGRVSSRANVLDDSAPTIMAVSEKAEERELDRLRSLGVEVIVGGEDRVDLRKLFEKLADYGLDSILLEGGSTLNWSMLSEGLVDEIRLAISPTIIGGKNARTLVEGEGASKISDGVGLKFEKSEKVGKNFLLIYKVGKSTYD